MKTFDNPDDELGEISPFLRSLKQQARHSSDDVPKNYFVDFEQKMMQKIAELDTKPVANTRPISRFRPWVWTAAVAASLVAVVSVVAIWYAQKDFSDFQMADYEQLKENVSREDVVEYLLERPEDLDLNWLATNEEGLDSWQIPEEEILNLKQDISLQEDLLDELEESDFYE